MQSQRVSDKSKSEYSKPADKPKRTTYTQCTKYTSDLMLAYELEQRKINDTQDAKKILDAFGNLSSESHNATRFIYELLQNARDQCCEGKDVQVIMTLNKKEFVFSHNGKPFKFIDLINIIKQGSNKDRPEKSRASQPAVEEEVKGPQNPLNSTSDQSNQSKLIHVQYKDYIDLPIDNAFKRTTQVSNADFDISQLDIPETTGRYGTGLLTTYLLSKHLIVYGVLHYDILNENNFRRFGIQLNRDGQTVSEIMKQIEFSFDQVEKIGKTKKAHFLQSYQEGISFDTSFSYQLYEQSQFETASKAINSLLQAAPFILVFNLKFSKITINDQTTEKTYSLSIDRKPLAKQENFSLFNYRENQTCKTLLVVYGTYSCVAALVEQDQDDYPLLGSETLGTSIVFNSHYFDPNEKRSGIPLSSGIKAEQNKFVVKECAQLYEKLVKYILEKRFKGVNNLQINPSDRTDRFLREILVTPCIKIFTENPVAEGLIGFIKLKEVLFPDIEEPLTSNSKEKVDHLMSLLLVLHKQEGNLVKLDFEYIKAWIQILQTQDWKPYLYAQNFRKISSVIEKIGSFESCQNFYQQYGMTYLAFQNFMNRFYDYLSKYSTSLQITVLRQSSIFLNQNMHFKPLNELNKDHLQNHETLKTFAKTYGYDIRAKMISGEVLMPKSLSSSSWNIPCYTLSMFDSELSNFLQQYYISIKTKKPMASLNTFVVNSSIDLLRMCYQTIHYLPQIEQYHEGQLTEKVQIDQQSKSHLDYIEQVKQLFEYIGLSFFSLNVPPNVYKFKQVPIKSQKIAINILLQEIYSKLVKYPNIEVMKASLLNPDTDPYKFLNFFYETIKKTTKVHKPNDRLMNPGVLLNQQGDFFKKETCSLTQQKMVKQYKMEIIFNVAFQDTSFVSIKEVDQMIKFYYTFTGKNRHYDEKNQVNIQLDIPLIYANLNHNKKVRFCGQSMCQELDKAIILKCNDRAIQKRMEKTILMFDDFYMHAFSDQQTPGLYFPQYSAMRKTFLVDIKQSGELSNQLFEILSQNRESVLEHIVKIPKEGFDTCEKIIWILSNPDATMKSRFLKQFIEYMESDSLDEGKIKELVDYLVTNKKNN
eukprot:403375833